MLGRVEGIVIRSTDYGEGHKIIVLLTRHTGKVSLIARGAKKTKSRHGSATQLFTHGEYTYFASKGLGNLRHVEIINSYRNLHEDIVKAAYAAYMAEMTDRMMEDKESSELIFHQFLAGLDGIADDKDADIVVSIFEFFMLRYAGYFPNLDNCVSCGNVDNLSTFHAPSGGVLCKACGSSINEKINLSPRSHLILQRLSRFDLRRIGTINVSAETKETIVNVTGSMIEEYVPVKWRSRSVLEQLKRISKF